MPSMSLFLFSSGLALSNPQHIPIRQNDRSPGVDQKGMSSWPPKSRIRVRSRQRPSEYGRPRRHCGTTRESKRGRHKCPRSSSFKFFAVWQVTSSPFSAFGEWQRTNRFVSFKGRQNFSRQASAFEVLYLGPMFRTKGQILGFAWQARDVQPFHNTITSAVSPPGSRLSGSPVTSDVHPPCFATTVMLLT